MMVRVLLANGADIDALDEDQRTAISLAAKEGHLQASKLLIDEGASIEIADVDGMTPLSWAVNNSDDPMLQLLNSKTEDPLLYKLKISLNNYILSELLLSAVRNLEVNTKTRD